MTKKSKEPSFEERMGRLQTIVSSLEHEEKSLEDSVALYKEGVEHAAACRDLLDKARHEIEIFGENGLTPFPGGQEGSLNGLQEDQSAASVHRDESYDD